ncbi:MAG: AAA family ATPase [Rhizobiaceae bacterium]|nr:AAA family ATPase [Rhizobiaceae bacterium]
MKRIMIIGQPGSGKSTLARQLGEGTGLPVVHIDQIHWKPGWVEREKSEKTVLCHNVHQREEWIFEGGHSATWPERLDRSDTLIWLDFPLWLRLWRVVARSLRDYGKTRPDLPENCPERFNSELYLWIWNTRHSSRAKMGRFFDSAGEGKRRYKFSNARQVQGFLYQLDTTRV